jgi:hypothetical protein
MKKSSPRRAPLAAQITAMFIRGEAERYRLTVKDLARAESLLEIAVEGERAVADVGSLLKLIHVLQTKRASPVLAADLSALLRKSKRARAIIRLHWSTQEKARAKTVLRAPHFNDEAPASSIKVATFLVPRRRMA